MRIGDRLILAGLITESQLNEALEFQKTLSERKRIVRVLVDMGTLDEHSLLQFFVEQCKKAELDLNSIIEDFPASESEILERIAKLLDMEYVNIDEIKINMSTVESLPFTIISKNLAIPFDESDKEFKVAIVDPFDLNIRDAMQRVFRRKPIKYYIAKKEQFVKILARLELNDSIRDLVAKVRREIRAGAETDITSESSSITKLIEAIFENAVKQKASDVHIEATEDNCTIRCRIDGVLMELFSFEKDMYPPLSSRIKLLSSLDIAEKRKPQDGRFSQVLLGREFDFRISTLPIITGESIVCRILDKSKVLVKLEELGMTKDSYDRFFKCIKNPYGIVFVTGPTGSGKTTTLYAGLNAIKGVGHKIITVEDPVEYQMSQIQQVMVNEKAGLTFASALRSILRQDPDIIMIGETRDQETLKIAIQSALTGHLVFSTLHTNDAISGITRLLDMGVESFFIGAALAGIQAQRLVRRICQECKYEEELLDGVKKEIEHLLPTEYKFYRSHGCKACNMSGYGGRELISEVVIATEPIKRLIVNGASKKDIEEAAREDGFRSMFEDGLEKALNGLTSVEEVYRVAKI